MNYLKKYFFFTIVLLTMFGCSFPSYIKHPNHGQESVFLSRSDLKIEFIETKSASGRNITMADVLEIEKNNYGKDITLINIKEQRHIVRFLYVFESIEVHYIYDVIRYKKP